MGDRLTAIGEEKAVEHVAKNMGNVVADLDEPNLVAIFVGLILGIVLGAVPISLPSVSVPLQLGLAGGPIIIGILVGAYGPRLHMITYTTSSVNRMLRALGIAVFLACLGLQAGPRFFDTVVRTDGALWVALGFVITVLPVVIVGWLSVKFTKLDMATVGGMICGSMANPMALDYVNDVMNSDRGSVAYTTVYPLCMFVRVIMVQMIIVLLM
jgi:AspT/YidE/YbjL antiporter-like protein